MTPEPSETLRRLEQRLTAASDAAERLIAATAAHARGEPPSPEPPPAGWQAPAGDSGGPYRRPPELELLISGTRLLGELVPAEALARLAAALRELLLAVRALIDFYVERLERPRADAPRVQDIPIE